MEGQQKDSNTKETTRAIPPNIEFRVPWPIVAFKVLLSKTLTWWPYSSNSSKFWWNQWNLWRDWRAAVQRQQAPQPPPRWCPRFGSTPPRRPPPQPPPAKPQPLGEIINWILLGLISNIPQLIPIIPQQVLISNIPRHGRTRFPNSPMCLYPRCPPEQHKMRSQLAAQFMPFFQLVF